jgi:outer membrane protein assembly factor BamB
MALQAELWDRAGEPVRAVQTWQTVLSDPTLRRRRLNGGESSFESAGSLAESRIDSLVRAHGSKVYDSIEEQARRRLAEARDKEREEQLRQVVLEFPNAAAAREARHELFRAEGRSGRDGAAAALGRGLLRRGIATGDRIQLLRELARLYEKERCWQAARSTWLALAATCSDQPSPALSGERPQREMIAERLQMPEYQALEEAGPATSALPLVRTWEIALGSEERMLPPQGPSSLGISDECIFFGSSMGTGGQLRCLDALSAKPRWTRQLAFVPSWVGCHADTILVGGQAGLCCLQLADGRSLWDFPAAAPLSAFQLTSSRMFCLEGGSRLLALEAETGETLWSRRAPAAGLGLPYPSGCFYPDYFAGEDRLLLQTGGGRRWLLDSRTGKTVADSSISREPWAQVPVAVGSTHVYLPASAGCVTLLDLAEGKEKRVGAPTHTVSLTGEAAQIVADRGVLLLMIPRNFGIMAQRLDASTGMPLWAEELVLSLEAITPAQLGFGREAFYLVTDNVLYARALTDGKIRWRTPLDGPQGRWRVLATPAAVIAWPMDLRGGRFRVRGNIEPVEWKEAGASAGSPLSATRRLNIPVLICDPRSGQQMQRLNFTLEEPQLVAGKTHDREARLMLTEHGRVVSVSRGGVIVALPGQACRLGAAPTGSHSAER